MMLLFRRLWVLLRSAEHKAMLLSRANHSWTFKGGSLDLMWVVGFEGTIGYSHDFSVGRLRSLTDHTTHVVVKVLGLLAEIGICTRSGWIGLPHLWLIIVCLRWSWPSFPALGLGASGVHAIAAAVAVFIVLTDLAVWVLSLYLCIRISAYEDAAAVHVIVVHSYIELIYILDRLLLLVVSICCAILALFLVWLAGQGNW